MAAFAVIGALLAVTLSVLCLVVVTGKEAAWAEVRDAQRAQETRVQLLETRLEVMADGQRAAVAELGQALERGKREQAEALAAWGGQQQIAWASGWERLEAGYQRLAQAVPTEGRPAGPAPESLVVTLLSEDGEPLGTARMHPKQRRPTISAWGTDGVLGRFAASHQDGETWVYRRVPI